MASKIWDHVLSANVGQLVHQLQWKNLLFTNVRLGFNMQRQTQSNWCWAATSTSVSLFYNANSGWTQCGVASAELDLACCTNPPTSGCNVPWYLNAALSRTGNFVSVTGVATFSTVESELQAGRVLGARVGWHGGGGHFMAIYGCGSRAGTQYFDIDDPIYGRSSPSVAIFTNNYQGSGSWTHTYLTRAARMRIRFPELRIDERLLKRVAELRPIIADPRLERSSLIDAGDVRLTLPHEIETIGLRGLVEGGTAGDATGIVRVVYVDAGRPSAFLDLAAGDAPDVVQIGGADNDYVSRLERGLEIISDHGGAEGEAEVSSLRLLRIPALYVEALVVRSDRAEQEVAVAIRSMQAEVPENEPMPLAEMLERLRVPARQALADADDELKGA